MPKETMKKVEGGYEYRGYRIHKPEGVGYWYGTCTTGDCYPHSVATSREKLRRIINWNRDVWKK